MNDEGRGHTWADHDGDRKRDELLYRFGRAYGAEHLAVAFTSGIRGEAAKRCTTRGWETTRPLADDDFGAALLVSRGRARNPVIVLRPSGLIGLESDTVYDLQRIEAIVASPTVTVRSSSPHRRHYYFRPPAGIESLPFVAFRFESGRVTADSSRYFVAPPALHPSGSLYHFLPGLALDEIGFAELPAEMYQQLVELARGSHGETRQQLLEDPSAKVLPGRRRDFLFRYGCALRRWTADRDEIARAVHEWNRRHCEPPVAHELVEAQIEGAMRKPGGQAVRDVV